MHSQLSLPGRHLTPLHTRTSCTHTSDRDRREGVLSCTKDSEVGLILGAGDRVVNGEMLLCHIRLIYPGWRAARKDARKATINQYNQSIARRKSPGWAR